MKASPKKETARIQVAPEPKPPIPKATVRMQPTQPLATAPAPSVRTSTAPVAMTAVDDEEEDSMTKMMSIVVAVAALISVVISYLAFAG